MRTKSACVTFALDKDTVNDLEGLVKAYAEITNRNRLGCMAIKLGLPLLRRRLKAISLRAEKPATPKS